MGRAWCVYRGHRVSAAIGAAVGAAASAAVGAAIGWAGSIS